MIVHLCAFDTAGDLRGRELTYENVKRLVVEAGRLSVFEASDTIKRARLYERLHRDPELEIVGEPDYAFPWIGVRRLQSSSSDRKAAHDSR